MPNHITNKIELLGNINLIDAVIKEFGTDIPATLNKTHDDAELICRHKTEVNVFAWMNIETGQVSNRNGLSQIGLPPEYEPEITQGFLCFPDFKKVIPPPDDPAYRDEPSQKAVQNSPLWWHTWNSANWGTKWSGYSYERLALNIFKFETAWSAVPLIIFAISKAFPEIDILYTYADEDSGYNCGFQLYKNGLQSEHIPKGGSKEAYDIYFSLNPDRKEDYALVDGKYIYKEEEEKA